MPAWWRRKSPRRSSISASTPVIKYLIRVPGMDPDISAGTRASGGGSLVSVTAAVVGEPLIEMGSKTVNKGRIFGEVRRHATALRRTR